MAADSNRRITVQRKVMLEELQRVTSHPTAAELYEMTRRRLPRISLGTVYRNLEILTADGHVRKLEIIGREARFDGNIEPHDHVRCVQCGAVEDIHGLPVEPVSDEVARKTTYKILGQRLEFSGICPECETIENERKN